MKRAVKDVSIALLLIVGIIIISNIFTSGHIKYQYDKMHEDYESKCSRCYTEEVYYPIYINPNTGNRIKVECESIDSAYCRVCKQKVKLIKHKRVSIMK